MTFTLKLNSKYEKKSAMLDLKTTCRLPRWGHFCGHPPNETLACGLTEVIRKQNLRMLLYSHQPCFTASPHETKVALNICFSWRKMELLVSVSAMCLMLFFFFLVVLFYEIITTLYKGWYFQHLVDKETGAKGWNSSSCPSDSKTAPHRSVGQAHKLFLQRARHKY